MIKEHVVLVDTNDNKLGLMEKLEAHRKGLLHRAFSVFVLDEKKRLLLQKRSLNKYHSPGLWTNTCCSHPRDNEDIIDAGKRRLNEEMGMSTNLDQLFSFIYKVNFDNGLTEHEFDHVLIGISKTDPVINKEEVCDWKWVDIKRVKIDLVDNSYMYTEWFKIIFEKFYNKLI
tara:strand:+ start:647 stop:1162 length:516 start_codon:yes stop_codon:yes gene_type:complete